MSKVSTGSSLLEKLDVIAFGKWMYSFQDPAYEASIENEREISVHDCFLTHCEHLSTALSFLLVQCQLTDNCICTLRRLWLGRGLSEVLWFQSCPVQSLTLTVFAALNKSVRPTFFEC